MGKKTRVHEFPPMIVTPLEPAKPQKKAVKRLDPEYANRKLLALKALLREGDITKHQFDRLKAEIIARVVAL
jgi:hypothetical protein